MKGVKEEAPHLFVPSPACARLLQRVDRWDLDMFSLYRLADEHPITAVGMKIIGDFGLWDSLPLKKVRFGNRLLCSRRARWWRKGLSAHWRPPPAALTAPPHAHNTLPVVLPCPAEHGGALPV